MNESGPIRKTQKDLRKESGFGDLAELAPSVHRACRNGRLWLLKTAKTDDSASLQMLRREYELSSKLRHPYIISAECFDEDTPVGPAIVMEYVEGRTLRSFLTENPSLATRKRIFGQILDAVEYLHLHGLLHNDLKLENVMVTTIGNDVRLIDFGLSETDADYLNRRLGGTQGASAPEVLSGDTSSSSSGASDIYSLGKILGQMFPGRYLQIVAKCLRPRPEDRFPDVDSLRRAVRGRDRRPWTVLAASALLVLLTAAIAPDIIRSHREAVERQALQEGICRVREDLTGFYQDASSRLGDRGGAASLDSAYAAVDSFVERTAEYRNRLDNRAMLPVCDSIYARLLDSLYTKMSDSRR